MHFNSPYKQLNTIKHENTQVSETTQIHAHILLHIKDHRNHSTHPSSLHPNPSFFAKALNIAASIGLKTFKSVYNPTNIPTCTAQPNATPSSGFIVRCGTTPVIAERKRPIVSISTNKNDPAQPPTVDPVPYPSVFRR